MTLIEPVMTLIEPFMTPINPTRVIPRHPKMVLGNKLSRFQHQNATYIRQTVTMTMMTAWTCTGIIMTLKRIAPWQFLVLKITLTLILAACQSDNDCFGQCRFRMWHVNRRKTFFGTKNQKMIILGNRIMTASGNGIPILWHVNRRMTAFWHKRIKKSLFWAIGQWRLRAMRISIYGNRRMTSSGTKNRKKTILGKERGMLIWG